MDAIRVRRFAIEDWDWLSRWYEDPVLNEQLGPLDQEWLEHVLVETDGVELVVTIEREPVAVVGCAWATEERDAAHVVTALAVDPDRRRRGLGRTALDAALRWDGHPPTLEWRAFVDVENPAAVEFFHASGWIQKRVGDSATQDDMHEFIRQAHAGKRY